MQISNSAFSHYSQYNNQYNNRPSTKPITIEGQRIDDDKSESADKNTVSSILENSKDEAQTTLLQSALEENQNSTAYNGGLFSQPLLQSSPAPASADASVLNQTFAYSNRRSVEGFAGSSLVIQKYLNNESSAQSQQSINIFV